MANRRIATNNKRREEEERTAAALELTRQRQEVKKLQDDLIMDGRKDLAKRHSRQQAYRRQVAYQKIQATTARAEAAKLERERLIAQTVMFKNNMLEQRANLKSKLDKALGAIHPDDVDPSMCFFHFYYYVV